MPSVTVKLYSVFFKALLKHRLQNLSSSDGHSPSSKAKHSVPANASFVDGVASKDIHIDPVTSLSLRIFLPECALPQEFITQSGSTGLFGHLHKDIKVAAPKDSVQGSVAPEERRSSYGKDQRRINSSRECRRSSWGGEVFRADPNSASFRLTEHDEQILMESIMEGDRMFDASALHGLANERTAEPGVMHHSAHYRGYLPDFTKDGHKKLPIIVQFHGGGFVTGRKDSFGNDLFCRRMAKLCEAIVIAVGYRLAPDHKYPAPFDDGYTALSWLAHQANLAEYSRSLENYSYGSFLKHADIQRYNHRELVDPFGGHAVVDTWLAAHGDTSRCVILGMSSGGNIADFVARKAVQAGRLLEPVKVVAQVLMYPFFIGSIPTHSEIKLSNSYFYDKSTCILAWKMLLSEEEYNLDHPVANPLVAGRDPPLKHMPPTLTVVGELDWMKDRAIAYSESLRKANLDAPVLEYKDAVHEFATLDFLVKSKEAEACAEDITIWIKKHITQRGHEFSY